MPISTETLALMQAAGAAVFEADTSLKLAVTQYAQAVPEALANNPFDLGTDVLFENWKTVARISKAMSTLEEEIKKLYDAASVISDTTVKALPVPKKAQAPLTALKPFEATDVVVKKQKPAKPVKVAKVKEAKVPVSVAKSSSNHIPRNMASRAAAVKQEATEAASAEIVQVAAAAKVKPAKKAKIAERITGNTAKLFEHLKTILDAKTFVKINQSEVGAAAGLSKGSIGASVNKLVATGYLTQGNKGEFKLAA